MSTTLLRSSSTHLAFSSSTALPFAMSEVNKSVNWDQYVFSEAFDRDCDTQSKRHSSSASGSSPNEHLKLWDSDDASSLTSVDSSGHGVSKLEAYLYYHGVRGDRKSAPKLIYRTSTDTFSPPSGPSQDLRDMQLLTVHGHGKLSQDKLWEVIRDETARLLDRKHIKYTSVDLVRFRRSRHGLATIWIGVLPDSTNGDAAFDSTQGILELLKKYEIDDIDIAYRESEAWFLAGPILYAPVNDVHPLKSVIDWGRLLLVCPSLGRWDLYGVTARHVLFPDTEGNDLYRYTCAFMSGILTTPPKKNVVLMGNRAFDDLLASIQALTGTLKNTVTVLKKRVNTYAERASGGNKQAEEDLAKYQNLDDSGPQEKDWSAVHNRVIGHVVWSPPITGLNPPHGYTCDVCVIKGNAIDLGARCGKFMSLLYPRYVAPSEFDYPEDRLYLLETILAAAQISEPNSQDIKGNPTRFVIKRGHPTLTTVGRLNGFESRKRLYSLIGNFDSVEAAVYPYDNDSGPFSRGGDSGAAIVGANNDLVAQLTGGTGPTDSSDITYGTPIEWLWNDVIKVEFPDAVLFFDHPASN
ncbi:hypothetical protein FA13DRAFT_1764439 [Coprinellus micaceus]|uniref:Uncharacterized protein n=1 Tax=Coprinellus micaceus TaxID=71717 RepID=A0A4Y7T9T0_COPMI|nr:hypothetical protein FA13DRAFT_1764439 [Coprinellus micaceus]